jgi:hypothetical protein
MIDYQSKLKSLLGKKKGTSYFSMPDNKWGLLFLILIQRIVNFHLSIFGVHMQFLHLLTFDFTIFD